MRWIIGSLLGIFALTLGMMIQAVTPLQPMPKSSQPPAQEVREGLTPAQCRMMAEHLWQDHGINARVLAGTQVRRGPFLWQDLTLELIGHPGFVFSFPHYLGDIYSQEVFEEAP